MFYSKEKEKGKKPHPCNTHGNTHTCTKHMETHTNFKNYMYTRVRHIINAKPWWVLGLSVVRVTIRSLLRWAAVGVANKTTQGLGLRFCCVKETFLQKTSIYQGHIPSDSVLSYPNQILSWCTHVFVHGYLHAVWQLLGITLGDVSFPQNKPSSWFPALSYNHCPQ